MSQDDQVLSIRLRRKNTGTPWGFRMHGGAEYNTPMFIQHVNPKSLAYRQGLRINDRLLAVGNSPTHNLTHEQVKMEIIRAGNELDFVVQRNMAQAGLDQQDSRPVAKSQKQQQQQYQDQPDEEPSEYRGYTNPKVQSRSFKMLQESLSNTDAVEEGIILPSGQTPGEGVVLRAYNEGKMRMQELAEINPRNFTSESPLYERGQNLLKCSEEDEAIIAKLNCSWKSKEPGVVSTKSYTPGSGNSSKQENQASQPIVLSSSSVLAPAADQQKYLQQAHANYGDQQAPIMQITINQPVQATKHQPMQAQTQSVPRRRERKRQPKEPQAQNIQSSVSVVQTSGFIPTTDTVSSVAVELNLKHASTVERPDTSVQEVPKSDGQSNEAQPVPDDVQSSQADVTKPQEKPFEEVAKESVLDDKPITQHKEAPKSQSEQKQASHETTAKPAYEKAEPIVDSIDASVEPTDDVIREYGERMAETVISESLQDATQGKRDTVDGSSESKVSEGVVTGEKEEATEPKSFSEEKPDISDSNTKVAETEPLVGDGKSEVDSQTAQVAQSSQISVALEDVRPETVVNVDSSQTEIVVESVAVTDKKESVDETSVDVSVEEVSKEALNVDLTQVTTQEEPSNTVNVTETSEITVFSTREEGKSANVEKSGEGTAVAVDVSESIVIDENVKISTGEAEPPFVVGGVEESSFVLEVQEDSKTGSSEIQSETFEISVGDNTEESANFTFDLGTNVSINEDAPTAEEGTEVSVSLESNEAVETVVVQKSREKTEDSKKEEQKSEQSTAFKTNTTSKTNIPPKKAKFVDSQGGVSARLARFNLKKK